MFKNYLKIALRNILKFKLHSLINIIGLAVAIACCLILFLFTQHELSFDAFHENADIIFRVNSTIMRENSAQIQATTPAPLGPAIKQELPEVAYVCRFLFPEYSVKYQDILFTERVTFTDPDFLKMFSFKFLIGNPAQFLKDKNTIIISKDLARKYFGENNPLGKQLTIIRLGKDLDFTVNGVIENTPDNSSIKFDILVSFEKLQDLIEEEYFSNWGLYSVRTFIQLFESSQAEAVTTKLRPMIKKYDDENSAEYSLQPLKDLHFGSTIQATMTPTSSITYSYVLSGITLLILVIAGFNSMNISTALASMRFKEIAVRKVMGAFRSQIMIQFCCETMILIAVAFILGIFLAELFLPIFNTLASETLTMGNFDHWLIAGFFIVLIVCLGALPGLFSALLLSKYQPVDLFLRRLQAGSGGYFSRSFIMIQFGLSICLIICTLVMANQLQYLKTKNLGFKPEQIVVIPFHTGDSQQTLENLRTELNQYAGIINVSGAISYPGGGFDRANVISGKASLSAVHIKVDYDFLETFAITLKEGRPFSRDIPSDTTKAIIINEAFANRMGWPSALGEKAIIEWMGWEVEVIGVIKDYHYTSFHETIGPLVLYLDPFVPFNYFFVKISPEQIPETITLLKTKWDLVAPDQAFEYFFLTEKFYQHYRADELWSSIVKVAAIVAIFIACFGLFGLSALIMIKRTKEIGIRKVVGASFVNIVLMLSKTFTKWIILANIIAWPLSYMIMNQWLNNFAYKIKIGIWIFLLAGGFALLIALITISYHAIKTALGNPVNSLRYE